MVAIKYLFLSAAAFAGVLAQDDAPTGDEVAAQAYWDAAIADIGAAVEYTEPAAKRFSSEGRATAVLKDPYAGSTCTAPFTKEPSETKCNRNNCFRSFLNARDGSEGKHCPLEAFGLCCTWNFAPDFIKYFGVATGAVYKVAPYTKNCKGSDDTVWDVVNKLDDVCGCTLNHEVTLDTTQAYYALKGVKPGKKECR